MEYQSVDDQAKSDAQRTAKAVAMFIQRRVALGSSAFGAYLIRAIRTWDVRDTGECPCCGYQGLFGLEPHLAMAESCPGCGSLERQRLLAIAKARGFVTFADKDVLHFAPDPAVQGLIDRDSPRSHVTGDLTAGRAQGVLNIENLALADASFDRIVCSHVLEHVDDRRALAELLRVLRPGGEAVLMVPLVEGWGETYENPDVTDDLGRTRHFGQYDHVRFFGADVRERMTQAGFVLGEFTADGADSAKYRLARGEKVFLARKP